MTWRKEPYPYTDEEIECFEKYCKKYISAISAMDEAGVKYHKVLRYPFGLPDGFVSILDLYDILCDSEKLEKLISSIKK